MQQISDFSTGKDGILQNKTSQKNAGFSQCEDYVFFCDIMPFTATGRKNRADERHIPPEVIIAV